MTLSIEMQTADMKQDHLSTLTVSYTDNTDD